LIVDGAGRPICTEMWPGNTADVTTLLPVLDHLRRRFSVGRVCVVADRGMISAATIAGLEARKLEYNDVARSELRDEDLVDIGLRQRYKLFRCTSAIFSPSKSPIALCSNQCRCNLHSLPGEINWWLTNVMFSHLVPSREGGRAANQNSSSRRKAAKRTIDGLWTTIGILVDAFTPAECANFFAATGYDAN
jgi:Transposase DDE domain